MLRRCSRGLPGSAERSLLLDDLHAADEATLQLVHYLARTARYQRLLIVMAFRDRPRSPALDRTRSGLFEQRLVAGEIALAALDPKASRRIAEQVSNRPLAEETADAIFGLARGNPFFTEELAATVDSKGAVEVPGHVYEILESRLARLEPTLVGVLARIAIAGSEVTVDELSSLVGLEEHDALVALDSALSAGVLEAGDGTYRFRHPLLREALERSLPDHRRLAAHRETAQRLASAGARSGARGQSADCGWCGRRRGALAAARRAGCRERGRLCRCARFRRASFA